MSRLDQLRLRDLLVLEIVAQVGTLQATAERLHISQPAVSQIVKSLEAAMGVSLLDRGQRGVKLTAAGQAALAHLRVVRRAAEDARSAARQPAVQRVRLGALPFTLLERVPQALARVRAAVPQLQIQLIEGSVDSLWQMLAEARLDALVGRLPGTVSSKAWLEGIWHQPIGLEPLVMVAPPAHWLAHEGEPTLPLLAEQEWVLPPLSALTRTSFDGCFIRAGVTPPTPVITCGDFHGNLQIAAVNALLTAVPYSAWCRYQAGLQLRELRVDWGPYQSDVIFACHQASLDMPVIQALRQAFLPAVT